MEKLISLLWEKVAPLWHKPFVGLGIALLGAISVSLVEKPTGQQLPGLYDAVLPIVTSAIIGGLWWYSNRIPKTPKGKVGLVFAILSDEEAETKQIEFDLVGNLRQMLQRDRAATNFHLLLLPSYIAQQINDLESANQYLTKTRGHFMVYGQATRRKHEGKEVHFLRLEGVVRHRPIPREVADRLANDFEQVLPRRLLLPRDNEPIAFEVTSAWVDISARYIIGLAALLSGDLVYAERLLLDVESSLVKARVPKDFLRPVTSTLPDRLKQLYRDWLASLGDNYFLTRNKRFIREGDAISNKLLAREPTDYGGLLFKAIAEFVLRRNVLEARHLISKCRRVRDVTWRYSLAFLHAYEGDLESAYHEYRRAFRGEHRLTRLPIECEEFIEIVLEEEPDKDHLSFCLGLINYNVKRDYAAARKDFQRFLGISSISRFPTAKRIAEELVAKRNPSLAGETIQDRSG